MYRLVTCRNTIHIYIYKFTFHPFKMFRICSTCVEKKHVHSSSFKGDNLKHLQLQLFCTENQTKVQNPPVITLQIRTNISPTRALLKIIFFFSRWEYVNCLEGTWFPTNYTILSILPKIYKKTLPKKKNSKVSSREKHGFDVCIVLLEGNWN